MQRLYSTRRTCNLLIQVQCSVLATVVFLLIGQVKCAQEGDIQLVGGPSRYEGNVFIYHLGSWGIVCDDDWSITNAKVVCRQLSYGSPTKHTKYNKYGTLKRRIWKDNVKCAGVETKLTSCPSNPWAVHNCNSKEAAGVKCSPPHESNRDENSRGIFENDLVPFEDRESRIRTSSSLAALLSRASRPNGNIPEAIAAILRQRYSQNDARARTPQTTSVNAARNQWAETAVTDAETLAVRTPAARRTTTTTKETPKPTTTATKTTPKPPITEPTTTPKPTTTAKPIVSATPSTTTPPNFRVIDVNTWVNEGTFTLKPRPTFKTFSADDVQNEMSKMADSGEVTEEYKYDVRIKGGRNLNEGRVEIFINDKWQTICGQQWGLFETMVVCRQLGLGHAKNAVKISHFGGVGIEKAFAAIQCAGHEKSLDECIQLRTVNGAICNRQTSVAGVLCSQRLPDLLPNITLLMDTVRLEDRSLFHLQCAMEENCVSSTAYEIRARYPGAYHSQTRRLLRFSSSVANIGTSDFHPHIPKESWEWHLCHMHYHSMDVFAHYDIIDSNGYRVAEGHKASFCLEDTDCQPGVKPHYQCVNFGDQGIRVGCADTYAHDIDCQWIDVTDLKPGTFKFTININPEYKVAELNYDNNQITCKLAYTGFTAKFLDCKLGRGTPRGAFIPTG